MNPDTLAAEQANHFYSSKNSELGKARRILWPCAALGLVLSIFATKDASHGVQIFGLALNVFIVLMLDAVLRKRLSLGKALVSIDDISIESPLFTGSRKRILWSDIVDVSFDVVHNSKLLRLHLAKGEAPGEKRWFSTKSTSDRISISLAPFDADTQEQLLDAIHRHLAEARRAGGGDYVAPINPLIEERRFAEQLILLAPVPWATYTLVAINILVWIATVAAGANVTLAPADKLLFWGGNAASEVQRGEWWRLLSATFLHSGVMHVAMNMLGLIGAGITVERIYGRSQFLLLYFGSGLVGSALSLHFSAQHVVSVGASGAVFGITGALLTGVFQHRERLPKLFGKQTLSSVGFFIVYALMQGMSKSGIDNAAHIGGLLGGCALAFVLPERFDMEHFSRTFKQRFVAGIAIAALTTAAIGAMAPMAAVDQRHVVDGDAQLKRGAAEFGAALRALQEEQQQVTTGKMTARQSDERSRTVYAPMFRHALADLTNAYLGPSDPRVPLQRDMIRITELIVESLEMDSVYQPGSDKPAPADPVRMAAIEAEIKQIDDHVQQLASEAKRKR